MVEDHEGKEVSTAPSSPGRAAVESAEHALSTLIQLQEDSKPEIQKERLVQAALEEASGLLEGMRHRRILAGQGKLSDLLNRAIEKWPEPEVDYRLFQLLGDCASSGISIEGFPLAGNRVQHPSTTQNR